MRSYEEKKNENYNKIYILNLFIDYRYWRKTKNKKIYIYIFRLKFNPFRFSVYI